MCSAFPRRRDSRKKKKKKVQGARAHAQRQLVYSSQQLQRQKFVGLFKNAWRAPPCCIPVFLSASVPVLLQDARSFLRCETCRRNTTPPAAAPCKQAVSFCKHQRPWPAEHLVPVKSYRIMLPVLALGGGISFIHEGPLCSKLESFGVCV